jgi:hypothetical protein
MPEFKLVAVGISPLRDKPAVHPNMSEPCVKSSPERNEP